MFFLILEKERSIKPLLLATTALIVGCLFIFTPMRASADSFFVVTQLPAQLDERMSVLSGFISNDSSDGANVWFEYGKNGKFEESSYKYKVMGTRDFTSRIYNIDPGIVYSYRAVGRKENSNVIKYGDTKTFVIDSESGENYNNTSGSDSTQQTTNYSGQTSGQCVVCCDCPQTVSSIKPTVSSGSA